MNQQSDLSAIALQSAGEVLKYVASVGSISGRRPKFFYFQLLDAFRLGSVARVVANIGTKDDYFTAEAVEVMARRILEQAILCTYIAANEGSEPIDRFLKTSAWNFYKSWKEENRTEDKDLPVKQLPNYSQMASTNPRLSDLYQKLSYLAHPYAALPYSWAEQEYMAEEGVSRQEFYRIRCADALACIAECINTIQVAFESEYAKWNHQSQSHKDNG